MTQKRKASSHTYHPVSSWRCDRINPLSHYFLYCSVSFFSCEAYRENEMDEYHYLYNLLHVVFSIAGTCLLFSMRSITAFLFLPLAWHYSPWTQLMHCVFVGRMLARSPRL
ncbi:hypothetical protein BJV78DRAFT_561914 [Lactifluus subvellereus]|nr:hypothetical protein BJV78DRAFT_561914 [Lactifluus subvellereus]